MRNYSGMEPPSPLAYLPGITTHTIALDAEDAARIDGLVASGRYPYAEALLREGLRLLARREQAQKERQAVFDAAIEEAEADFRAGRFTTIRNDADIRRFVEERGKPG